MSRSFSRVLPLYKTDKCIPSHSIPGSSRTNRQDRPHRSSNDSESSTSRGELISPCTTQRRFWPTHGRCPQCRRSKTCKERHQTCYSAETLGQTCSQDWPSAQQSETCECLPMDVVQISLANAGYPVLQFRDHLLQ